MYIIDIDSLLIVASAITERESIMLTVNFEISENCPVQVSVIAAHCPNGFQALGTPTHPVEGQTSQIPYRARGLLPHHAEHLARLLFAIDGQESIACLDATGHGFFIYGATGEIRPDWNGLPFNPDFFAA